MNPGKSLFQQLNDNNKGRFHESNKHIGVSVGTVIFPPSTDPLKHNRIRITMPPWPEDDPTKVTPWVRMGSLGCGVKSGVHFPPKKGDKVIAVAYRGDPHQLFYFTYPTVLTPPPDEQRAGIPELRWMIRVQNGHKLEMFEETEVCHNNLETAKGHQILEDDVTGQEKIKLTEYEGRYINLDSINHWIDMRVLTGNRFRLRDDQNDQLQEHPTGSFIWIKNTGDIHIHAAETLHLTGKNISIWPTDDLTVHIPATTHKCVEEGVDYINCPLPPRETRCYNCETGEETEEIPPSENADDQMVYTITEPSDTWEIQHNMGKYPNIKILQEGFEVDGYSKQHISVNKVIITFNSAETGIAVLD